MGITQTKSIQQLPDGTMELTFIDPKATQRQYKKYVVTYKDKNDYIGIEKKSTSSNSRITCSHTIQVHHGFVFRTIFSSERDISAFGNESNKNKVLLMDFIKEYTSDVENTCYSTDWITREYLWYESMILSTDGEYYEILYNLETDTIRIKVKQRTDKLKGPRMLTIIRDSYPEDVYTEVLRFVNTLQK